jgi:hypothetical protein
VHHAAGGQLEDLLVGKEGLVEHPAVLEDPPHQLGVGDRGAVVAEGDRPGLDELADLGELLALAVLACAGDDEHVAGIGPRGLLMDELDRRLRVDRRLGVGDAGDAREPAGQGGPGAGLDRLVFLAARLPEVDVHVDQPRRDDQPAGVDRLVDPADRLGAGAADGDHLAVADEHVVDPVDPLRRIDHPAAADHEARHQEDPPGRAAARGPQVSQSTPIRTARPLVT